MREAGHRGDNVAASNGTLPGRERIFRLHWLQAGQTNFCITSRLNSMTTVWSAEVALSAGRYESACKVSA